MTNTTTKIRPPPASWNHGSHAIDVVTTASFILTFLTIVGIERGRVPKVRAQLRELSQQHAAEIGRVIEVTCRVMQQDERGQVIERVDPETLRVA